MPNLWIAKLESVLRKHALVKHVHINPNALYVRYTTGVLERFWYSSRPCPRTCIPIVRAGSYINQELPIYELFETDLINPDNSFKYFAINKDAYYEATTVERAIARQALITKMLSVGYQLRLPAAAVAAAYTTVASSKSDLFVVNNAIRLFATRRALPGHQLLGHFFDFDKMPMRKYRAGLENAVTHPWRIYRGMRRLDQLKRQLTSRNVFKILFRRYGPILPCCKAYEALFRHIGVAGSLYDPHPCTGVKALAAALFGLTYVTGHDTVFDAALLRGFGDFVKLNHYYGESADWAIVDWNFVDFNYAEALAVAEKCKRLIVLVPEKHKQEALRECRPELTINVLGALKHKSYFFVW